jgi:catechol 2,3-dioxygenase-like lactoylglutathione lyase family enzyme
MLKLEDVTHWSIPVNDLEEAEKFYRDVLGMTALGRIHHGTMSCFALGGDSIILASARNRFSGRSSRTIISTMPSR